VREDDVQPVSVRHEALPGVYRATCRVALREETRFGKLHVLAVDENGAPLRFGVGLKALDRDLARNDRQMLSPPEGWTWELPAGRWEVEVVLGKEVLQTYGDGVFARGFEQHVVAIEHGRTTELRVVAPPKGTVAFRLFAKAPPDGMWQRLRMETAGRPIDVVAQPRHRGGPVSPFPLERGEFAVLFLTKQALPPGRHTFVLQGDGYEPATCTVDVVTDRLTTARVDMLPR
jgi:hypothetical protein